MTDCPKVFISILNWNGLEDTLDCLASVFRLDYRNLEVIVVDNASSDNSAEIIQKTYPKIILIKNQNNLGFTGGNNVAMRYAIECGADYVWLLNNDAVVEVCTLSVLIDAAEKDRAIGLVSPMISDYSNPAKVQSKGHYVDWKKYEIRSPLDLSGEVEQRFQTGQDVCLWGTALLVKLAVIEKIGYLDERYFAYHEDIDYSIRALKAGFRNLLCPNARVFHKNDVPFDKAKSPHHYYYRIRNLYFLRNENFLGRRRINMERKYLAEVLNNISHVVRHHRGHKEYLDAVVTGAWHGIMGIGGKMLLSPKAPYGLEKILVLLGSYPPYFWSNLIEGNVGLIVEKIIAKARGLRYCAKKSAA